MFKAPLSSRVVRARLTGLALVLTASLAHAQHFSIEQVLSAPFASSLAASPDAQIFAWASNRAGERNVWVARADGGTFKSTAVTHYTADDGQELSDITFVPGSHALLYVRGGDVEYPDKPAPNPAELQPGVTEEIWRTDLDGGTPERLGEGHAPRVSPDGKLIVFLHAGGIYRVSADKNAKAETLFKVRGAVTDMSFSPAGDALAFVSDRGDHSFIGIYRFADKSIRWLDPGIAMDMEPRWSPDGRRIAYLRLPSMPDEVQIVSHRVGPPWSIRVASVADASAADAPAHEVYRAPQGAGSVFRSLSSDVQLMWCGGTLVFPAENDGWLHLYAVSADGGPAHLLTPGEFEIEFASAAKDGHSIVYSSNAGDTDRRHLTRLDPITGKLQAITQGTGIETQPALLSDGTTVAFIRADARMPSHAAVVKPGSKPLEFFAQGVPGDFPAGMLTEPQSVRLPERAGIAAHAILFLPPHAGRRRPALVFMHGGPVRQMLLGWHYMDYYSNAYGMNQYLANAGYVVLSLNYRAGIGYGLNFREADGTGAAGAAEYNDVLAAAEYLRSRPDVDAGRIGLWGGSYGGYLTALGLARNSDVFKAGVDLHGVHDWYHWTLAQRDFHPFYPADATPSQIATSIAASPIASLDTWRSPVLIIQGDDDHNVDFSESVRLAEGLRARGVDYSELVFPDEIHGFLRHQSWLRAYGATAKFLDAHLNAAK
ncbi:MAG TPA: prolyl oligopeptidase family serine peptidase [Steroidobacteraceae bacterium]|jgi:dipeptidyl aminopeptidase/acylaminoacyl peptidase|nr:prolyl oligopeptidase family serine peptidase [Steroidobacteraceae bacterium]